MAHGNIAYWYFHLGNSLEKNIYIFKSVIQDTMAFNSMLDDTILDLSMLIAETLINSLPNNKI